MKLADALILWDPLTGRVAVGPITEGRGEWAKGLPKSAGAAFAHVRKLKGGEARCYVMSEFLGLVVRDGIPVQDAHRAFLKIEEYRQAIPRDTHGAEDDPEET